MSNIGDESQLSLDINCRPGIDDLDSNLPESLEQKWLAEHGITEEELDIEAEKHGGLYSIAISRLLRRHQIDQSAFDALNREGGMIKPSVAETKEPVTAFKPIKVDALPVTTVNLGERALNLTIALNELQDESRELEEKLKAERDKKHSHEPLSDEEYKRIVHKRSKSRQAHLENADKAFRAAFGASAMVSAGEDPVEANYQEQLHSNGFNKRYTGPENHANRNELLGALMRQVKKTSS